MKNKITLVIGIIALSLIIINMSASHSKLNKSIDSKNSIEMKTLPSYEFDYTGGEQVFIVPYDGKYMIETWGAQGGYAYSEKYNGGYGGYSSGIIYLNSNNSLYVNIGGHGTNVSTMSYNLGGYNGGGNSSGQSDGTHEFIASPGGGATHIATISGLLSTLENNKDSILIVSGGGGGSSYNLNDTSEPYAWGNELGYGGSGGGYIGNNGYTIYLNESYHMSYHPASDDFGKGGTQTSGGQQGNGAGKDGTFGQGGSIETSDIAYRYQFSAGGGGYYGGGTSWGSGSGGGSGYIDNSSLTNKHMACYNCKTSNEVSTKTISVTCASETPTADCSKIGNGYAKITYLGN